jgi:hypothetical protein
MHDVLTIKKELHTPVLLLLLLAEGFDPSTTRVRIWRST